MRTELRAVHLTLTGELAQLLRLDETADGIVTRESLIASKVVFCATDDITGVSYLCTDNGDLSGNRFQETQREMRGRILLRT